jgi:hypothetical protein
MPVVMRAHCLPPNSRQRSPCGPVPLRHRRLNLRVLRSGSARSTAEALRSKAPRQKGQQHDLCCPRGRVVRGGRSRAHRASRLPPTPAHPLIEKTTPARREPPGRFNFLGSEGEATSLKLESRAWPASLGCKYERLPAVKSKAGRAPGNFACVSPRINLEAVSMRVLRKRARRKTRVAGSTPARSATIRWRKISTPRVQCAPPSLRGQ